MNFEAPLTSLVWLTSIVSIALTYVVSLPDDSRLGRRHAVVEAVHDHLLRHAGRRVIPELVKVFTSTESRTSRKSSPPREEGGASLNILSGFVAGNFSATGWALHGGPDGMATGRQHLGSAGAPDARAGGVRLRPGGLRLPGHGPGDHRRRFLRPGHRQRAVGLRAVADRTIPNIKRRLKKDFGIDANFERAKDLLEENDGAGNTFKATAKPVLIGTAVVGATTMIFSIIMALTTA
jgi:K(+)-stimulated pyrophosphate-energized sodium pump